MKINSLQELDAILRRRFERDTIAALRDIEPPSAFLGMQEATRRIVEAIKSGEEIAVVGDYDADGVIASAILSAFFDCVRAKSSVYLPDRFGDGYGISPAIVDRIGASLIVTVDNGASAFEAADRAKALGKTLIITDHHVCRAQPPQAFAIVNPKQPDCPSQYKELCGAAIAWYLAASLTRALNADFDLNEALALVAIASIADCVELKSANRALVKAGVKRLNASAKPYAKALREALKADIDSEAIAYKIAPKINAAGRIAHSRIAYDFLKSATATEAKALFAELDALSKERKRIEEGAFDEALKQIGGGESAVVVSGEGWHEGVIGIVAARLAERFKKPAVVIAVKGESAKASARSWGKADLFDLFERCGEYITGFGGHKKAAGATLRADRIAAFADAFRAACASNGAVASNRDILGELDLSLVSSALCDLIAQYEPFGEGNPKPIFVACDAPVKESKTIGENGAHLRLSLERERGGNDLQAIWFFASRDIKQNDRVSFYYSILPDRFNGVLRVKLRIEEMID